MSGLGSWLGLGSVLGLVLIILSTLSRYYCALGLERIHQATNTIRIANIGWRIRICIREYTFFSEAINFIRQCSKFHTVIKLSNFINLIKTINEMNEFTIFYQHQL